MTPKTVIILLTSLQLSLAFQSCQTPHGKPGICQEIEFCPPLFNHFKGLRSVSDIPAETRGFLLRSRCGAVRGRPKVCCSLDTALELLANKTSLFPERCGNAISSRIVGGTATKVDEFPWMALLQYKGKNGKRYFQCGGFLITKRYVLTARHCLRKNLVSVRLGEHDVRTDPDCIKGRFGDDCNDNVLDVPLEETIPFVDKTDATNDIGLIRLSRDVDFTDFIKPICLPTAPEELSKNYINEKLFVAGWGLTENETYSFVKLKVEVPVRDISDCVSGLRSVYKTPINLHEYQLCAGAQGKDSCNGDSGGPLMGLRKDFWTAFAIVSFGPFPCGQASRPGVYVKLSPYVNWIIDKVKE